MSPVPYVHLAMLTKQTRISCFLKGKPVDKHLVYYLIQYFKFDRKNNSIDIASDLREDLTAKDS